MCDYVCICVCVCGRNEDMNQCDFYLLSLYDALQI